MALRLLGRGVARGPDQHADRFGPGRLGERARQPEVCHAQGAVLSEEEVRRLDVAVHDATAVRVGERATGLYPEARHLRQRERCAPVEQSPEAAPSQVLEDQVRLAVVLPPVEHRDDVRVGERCGGTSLRPEALQEARVVGERSVEQLHGHAPDQGDVVGEVDLSRRAPPDGREQPVAPGEHPPDLLGKGGACHPPQATGRLLPYWGPPRSPRSRAGARNRPRPPPAPRARRPW